MARKKEKSYPQVRRRINGKKKDGSTSYSWIVDLTRQKRRQRVPFRTKEAAEIFAQQKRVEYRSLGTSWSEMPETAKAEAVKLWKHVQEVGTTLTDAVSFYFKHARPDAGERLVKDVVEEMLAMLRTQGRSAAYIQVQSSVLRIFSKALGEMKIHTLMSRDIEEWIASNNHWSPRTRLNYQRDLSSLWNYAIRKKYAAHNPLESIDKPTIPSDPPGILTTDQAKALLTAASEKQGREMVPYIAIGLFAGLRPAEIERLEWSEVDIKAGLIEVTAKKAKTRQRRHVTISRNLAAWLCTVKVEHRKGRLTPPGAAHDRVVALAEGVGIKPWPRNALRHSFASYHLANYKEASRTALELGHSNQDMLFRNYRELVRPAAAAKYWKITP